MARQNDFPRMKRMTMLARLCMGKLMWQVMQDNRISDPGHLQPGTVIVIRAKKARE